jgi:hypothetical protein
MGLSDAEGKAAREAVSEAGGEFQHVWLELGDLFGKNNRVNTQEALFR